MAETQSCLITMQQEHNCNPPHMDTPSGQYTDSLHSGWCALPLDSIQSHITPIGQIEERERTESRGSVTRKEPLEGMGRLHIINTVKYSHLTHDF